MLESKSTVNLIPDCISFHDHSPAVIPDWSTNRRVSRLLVGFNELLRRYPSLGCFRSLCIALSFPFNISFNSFPDGLQFQAGRNSVTGISFAICKKHASLAVGKQNPGTWRASKSGVAPIIIGRDIATHCYRRFSLFPDGRKAPALTLQLDLFLSERIGKGIDQLRR